MTPRSIVIATDIDVLPRDRIVARRNGYTLVRSPSNPAHHWGNLLLFDEPPDSGDAERWAAVVELQVAGREERYEEQGYRQFSLARLAGLRALFASGRGAWYVALDPAAGALAASCGIVVTGGRGRFQLVETALDHRRRGIATRLLVDAADHSAAVHGAERFVIVTDAAYHALGLYESLGFERKEHVFGVSRL